MSVDRAIEALRGVRLSFSSEEELQQGIERVWKTNGLTFKREWVAGPGDRPDFLLEDDTAVEVKVDGGIGAITRQLLRYADHPRVKGILLVTSKAQHAAMLPPEMNGKPVRCHLILRGIA